MNKAHIDINWENYPSDETPLNERNLNKMDGSIDIIDDRVITLDTTKATKAEVATLVADVTFEESTGIITITKKNGSKITIDTQMEKIAINFDYNPTTQQIILTLIDGTKQYIDLSALITQYEFLDSDTVAFYIDKDGKLITESLIDYTRKNILGQYARLDVFLKKWNEAKKKQAIVEELREDGVLLDAVREETGQTDIDDFDLILHLAYDKAPLTRIERIKNVQKRGYLYKYSELAQKVLGTLMDKYASEGLKEIEETKVLQLHEFQQFGSPMKIVKAFGGKAAYEQAVKELEDEIFSA